MRVLVASHSFDKITHGPAKFVDLIRQDHQVFGRDDVRFLAHDVAQEINGKVYKYDYKLPRGIGIFWEYVAGQKIYNWVKKNQDNFKPDIILFVEGILGYHCARHLDIPCVGMINDNEYMDASLAMFGLSKEWIIKGKSKILERQTVRQLDHIITNSDFLKHKIIERYTVDRNVVTRLYKSIDLVKTEKYKHTKRIDRDEIKILFVKNDWERGGLNELLQASQKLQNKGIKLKITIVGPHKKDFTHIDPLAKRHGINIDLRGTCNQTEVFDMMLTHDIFCVPSRREALGVANIEALAIGIPVVSTKAGGIPEVTNNDSCAWLAKPSDSDDLAHQLYQCLSNDTVRTNKTIEGKIFVTKRFDSLRMLTELRSILSCIRNQL